MSKKRKNSLYGGWSSDVYEQDDYDYYPSYYGSNTYGVNRTTTGGGSRDYGYGYQTYQPQTYRRSTGFSWGNWGWDDEDSEDDLECFVKSHESYMTPKNTSINITNWQQDTEKNRTFIKEMSRFFYYKMLQDKNYIHDKYADEETQSGEDADTYHKKKAFYDDLWNKDVPGFSPLEKAKTLFDKMMNQDKSKKEVPLEEQDITKCLSDIEFHDEDWHDPIINELMDMNAHAKKNKYRIFDLMFYIKNLGSEFKIEKEIEERIVPNSHLIAKKVLRDYNQLYRTDLYQRIFPTYRLNLIQKNLIINAPVEKTEHKQKIIILLDYSGSMDNHEKQDWVVALMMDRLKHAMKEECEIFFSYFVTECHEFHHIYDRKTALAFWKRFSTRPDGGVTDIGGCVNYVHDEIINKKKLGKLQIDLSEDKPEILIINDGKLCLDI